jgi:uncharacterized protein
MPSVVAALRRCKGADDVWDMTKVPSLLAAARGSEFDAIVLELGEELIIEAATTNNVGVVRMLLQGFGVGACWKSCYIPTTRAAYNGHVEVLELLFDSGVREFGLHAKNKWKRTAIHAACHGGRVDTVEFLLARGARTDGVEDRGRTPAYLAIVHGADDRCLRALLRAGADASSVVQFGDSHWSLVELAAYYKRPVAVAMLLRVQAGRSVDAIYLGRALCVSSHWHSGCVIPVMLLNSGADIGYTEGQVMPAPFLAAALNGFTTLARTYAGIHGQAVFENGDVWASAAAPVCNSAREEVDYARFMRRVGLDARVFSNNAVLIWARAFRHDNVALLKMLVRSGTPISCEKGPSLSGAVCLLAVVGATKCVDFLIDAGADLNDQRFSSMHCLVGAAIGNTTSIIQKLLRAGANIHASDHGSESPLQQYPSFADFFWGDLFPLRPVLDVFKHLSRLGDVNYGAAVASSQSCFYRCAFFGRARELQFLIENGVAEIDCQQPGEGYTPLMASIFGVSFDCCAALLESGANLSLRTHASSVLEYADVELPIEAGMDALLCASAVANYTLVAKLLEYGADATSCDGNGRDGVWLALRKSAESETIEQAEATVDVLLNHGAPIDSCEAVSAVRSIHVAAEEGCFRALEALATKGEDVNYTDNAGNTALHWAVLGHRPASPHIATMVRDFGANVNSTNSYGETALHIATCRSAGDEVKVLLDVGSDVDARDNLGRTPLMLACGAVSFEIPGDHKKNGGSVKRRRFCQSNIVLMLVKRGADVSLVSARGMGALHFASLAGHVSICRYLLLSTNTKPSRRNRCGRTPLHLACRHGHASVAEVLISKGAKVDARDSKGRTPLFDAASRGHSDCVSLLLKSNADARTVCDSGQTPLSEATRLAENSIVRILVSQETRGNGSFGCDAHASPPNDLTGESLCLVGGADAFLDGTCT